MSLSLVSGWVPVVVPVVAVVTVLSGVNWRTRAGRRGFAGAVVTASVVTAGVWWAQLRGGLVPYDVAASTYGWIWLLLLAVCAPVAMLLGHRSGGSGRASAPRRGADAARPSSSSEEASNAIRNFSSMSSPIASGVP